MWEQRCLIALVLVPAALAALGTRRGGWLDRVVLYHKQKLFNELRELAPIQISAEIQQKPVGYVDSPEWDYDSVQRLLTLLRASETAKPVHKALRRMLRPSRRLMMSMKESKHWFPSIKSETNDFYYDGYSSSAEHTLPAPPPVPEDQVVLAVSNPVEARLPSARISVKLLREILEARARAARQMPTTKEEPWKELIRNRTRYSSSTELATTQRTEPADKPDDVVSSTKADDEENSDDNAEIATTVSDDNANITGTGSDSNANITTTVSDDNTNSTNPVSDDNANITTTVSDDNTNSTNPVSDDNANITTTVSDDNANITTTVSVVLQL